MKVRFGVFVILFYFSVGVQAQYFMEAPKLDKKVKQIIEWMQLDGDVVKANTSYFNKSGKLVGYYNKEDKSGEKITLKYDSKNRLVEKKIGSSEYPVIIKYAYKKNTVIREEHFRGKVFKVFEFRNSKGQMIEKKTFLKGGELGEKFILRERYLYTYNAQDSLRGEVHYSYTLEGRKKGKQHERKKNVFYYNQKTGKRSKVEYFDINGKLVKYTVLEYHKNGRLKKETTIGKTDDANNRSAEYHYHKDGSIWQIIEHTVYKKFVKIYKDNRLIRHRTYIGKDLFSIVDFQYVFY